MTTKNRIPKISIFIASLFFITALFITQLHAGTTAASSAQHYANYVILGQAPNGDNIAIARTVIDEAILCPTVSKVGEGETPISMLTRNNPNHFSVVVCEALISFDTAYQVNFSDKSIPLAIAKSNPKQIQVFGDTGCKKSKPGKKGGCAIGSPAEPFKSLADAGAGEKPDMVIHVGDYNYRGTSGDNYFSEKNAQGLMQQVRQWPYDAGDGSTQGQHCGQAPGTPFYSQSALNSNYPDIWRNWHDDVFKPAKNLMAVAPWVVTRGNHELCSRAGPGYFYFMDSNSNRVPGGQQYGCPSPDISKDAIDNTVQLPTFKLTFKDFDMVVIDSANACDSFADSSFTPLYEKVFQEVNQLTTDKPTWLMGHRPIWGITKYYDGGSTGCTSDNQYGCVNQMMQAAIKKLPSQALPPSINLVLAGHMHRFQSVSFASEPRPPQLVIGSSGVALDSSPPKGDLSSQIDGLSAQVLTTNDKIYYDGKKQDAFGYLRVKVKESGDWKAHLVNPPKKITLAECRSKNNLKQGVCEFSKGISVSK